jgi:hypothetical protein
MAANAEMEERIRRALEGLQHSHVEITRTTRGVTFSLKVRDEDPLKAAGTALMLYARLKKELKIE